MEELYIRTEDIRLDEVINLFVETAEDRKVVSNLCIQTPVVLVGSRGVGKSFLMRVAQAELKQSFEKNKVLPVYVSFYKLTAFAVTVRHPVHRMDVEQVGKCGDS